MWRRRRLRVVRRHVHLLWVLRVLGMWWMLGVLRLVLWVLRVLGVLRVLRCGCRRVLRKSIL